MSLHPYDSKLQELNFDLPAPAEPVGSYHPVVIAGNVAYLSGQISKKTDGELICGRLGTDLDLEQGKEAAHVAALNVVSLIKSQVGFDRFERILRIVGYVQVDTNFTDIHKVMNGASDTFKTIFGDKGIHARSAVGMANLPLGVAVEIEATLQIKE